MEIINSLTVKDLTREHNRKCESRKGIQKLEPGQNIHQLSSCLEFYSSEFCNEIPDFCHFEDIILSVGVSVSDPKMFVKPLNPELNPICYLLALLAHHFLHVSRIRVKSLTLRLLMSYIYIYIYIYIWSIYS